MTVRIEVGYRPGVPDPRGRAVLGTIHSFLGIPATDVRSTDVYTIDAPLSAAEVDRARQHFADAVTQRSAIGRLEPEPGEMVVAVGFRPGVTDAVGKSALIALRDMLGRDLGRDAAVYTSRVYFLAGVHQIQAERIATGLLANPLIETFEVIPRAVYEAREPDLRIPAIRSAHRPTVQVIDFGRCDDDLMRLSRERVLSLSVSEMRCIRDAFASKDFIAARAKVKLGPAPTDVELECLAQTWSEHCKHKIFNATIHYREQDGLSKTIRSLFKEHIRASTEAIRKKQEADSGKSFLVSVFHDNAGVIAFNERMHLVYKAETHNSPSALDPYGGAMTGIVGVNRDPFGTGLGAELLVNVWGYCLADPHTQASIPQGLMHPRRIRDGVHRGVIEGGNQSGIPYGRGWEIFDDRYLGKPLVFCGTIGKMPVKVAERLAHEKQVCPGDKIVMCGGRIGKDGIHGATFSSAELDESSPVQAVQIGDPITQKCMFDFLLEARDADLYRAITDNGAGGLSSSVGELCTLSGGARLDLALAPLKYAGLDPWEILISEAQERMTLAVAPEHLDAFMSLAKRREVEATVLGDYTDNGHFEVLYNGEHAAYLPLSFLHEGLPPMELNASWTAPVHSEPKPMAQDDWSGALVAMLRRPNLTSGEKKARHYDHEVKGLSVIHPYVGLQADMPSDATVFMAEHGYDAGYVLSEGVNPFYSDIDTWWMTASVIDEAVRKAIGTGGRLDHMAGLDNYCWPDPVESDKTPDGQYKLAQLVRSTSALSEFCQTYGVPCISGKDSMKNDSSMGGVKISIPPTLLFSVIAKVDDVTRCVTMDPKQSGDLVYLLGRTRDELGGSEYYRYRGHGIGNKVPRVDPSETLPLYRAVEEAIRRGLLHSCHSPTKGGVLIALARMAMAAELGLDVDIERDTDVRSLGIEAALFSESNGRFVVTVAEDRARVFEEVMNGIACHAIGSVTQAQSLRVRRNGSVLLDASLFDLKRAWKETFDAI